MINVKINRFNIKKCIKLGFKCRLLVFKRKINDNIQYFRGKFVRRERIVLLLLL